MKPLGRLKNVKGWIAKKSNFKTGNWWEECSEPYTNKSARRILKLRLKKDLTTI